MSKLNIIELLNEKVREFGNERFLEGWKGSRELIIDLLERTCDCDKSNPVVIIHRCENRFALALIKLENR